MRVSLQLKFITKYLIVLRVFYQSSLYSFGVVDDLGFGVYHFYLDLLEARDQTCWWQLRIVLFFVDLL